MKEGSTLIMQPSVSTRFLHKVISFALYGSFCDLLVSTKNPIPFRGIKDSQKTQTQKHSPTAFVQHAVKLPSVFDLTAYSTKTNKKIIFRTDF